MAKQFNQPLPKYSQFYGKELFAQDANRGLIWARFFEGYTSDFSGFLDIKEQTDRVTRTVTVEAQMGKSDFVKRFNGTLNFSDALATRTRSLVDSMGGSVACYQTQGRFVTGMGNDHPTENGFTWHPTLGVPYLPASSVKGLVRGWIEWNGTGHQHHADLKNWFGSQSKSEVSEQAGWFIFFDALPTSPVQLAADVMTPHYDKWYEQGSDETKNTNADTVPADWHNPVPVTFLTVKKATFQFGIAVRAGLSAEDKAVAQTALPQVQAVLQDALEWAGAGAKTATGYGRMGLDEKASADAEALQRKAETARIEQQRIQSLAMLSPNLRSIEEMRVKIEKQISVGKIAKGHALWTEVKRLALEQSSGWDMEEKIALADMLQNQMQKLMQGMDAKDIRKELKLASLRGQV